MTRIAFTALALAGMAFAQNSKSPDVNFQYFSVGPGPGRMIGPDVIASPQVTGRPFAATEERHSLQVLGDGTRIENTEKNRIFRDAQGRTRIERPDGTVTIQDPVEGTAVEIDPNGHAARHASVRFNYVVKKDTSDSLDKMKAELMARKSETQLLDAPKLQAEAMVLRHEGLPGAPARIMVQSLQTGAQAPNDESLGTQFLNGVNAEGHRSTIKIPAGQIGNDRPMQVVSERWFSNDLQMTVKTSNSDPRFGDTTYELTGITQGAQDPSLFTIPADLKDATK